MQFSDIQLLLTINFLHAVSGGLVQGVIPYHVVVYGGNYFLVGFLHTMVYICHQIRKELLKISPKPKSFMISFSLWFSFFLYFSVVFYSDLFRIGIIRCLYGLTINIQQLSRQFIERTEPGEEYIKDSNLLNMMRFGGLALGAILGGYVYGYSHDLSTNGILSSCLTLVCLLLWQRIKSDDSTVEITKSRWNLHPINFYDKIKKMQNIEYADDWENLMLKTTYVFTFSIFLSRVAHFLISNYELSSDRLGYTIAYENVVTFIFNCIVPFIKKQTQDPESLLENSMTIGCFAVIGFYFAPTYHCCLIVFTVVMFTYSLNSSLLGDDVFEFRTNEELHQICRTLVTMVNVFAPFIAGILGAIFGTRILKIMGIIPSSLVIFLSSQKFIRDHRYYDVDDFDDDEELQDIEDDNGVEMDGDESSRQDFRT